MSSLRPAQAARNTDMPEGNGLGPTPPLDALCRLYGVASEYTDIWGKTQRASDETRLALLSALGALDESRDLAGALRSHEQRLWKRILPRVAVFRDQEPPYRIALRFRESDSRTVFQWTLALEHG